ncbi:MAG: hypothetical protein JWO31_898, partial [Phycisphaerales bacterium]|nr:hypothetical protein [Phycisphaerales bacterium]
PAGVVSVTTDGQTTEWDRKSLRDELEYWESKVARDDGRRPRVFGVDLSGF